MWPLHISIHLLKTNHSNIYDGVLSVLQTLCCLLSTCLSEQSGGRMEKESMKESVWLVCAQKTPDWMDRRINKGHRVSAARDESFLFPTLKVWETIQVETEQSDSTFKLFFYLMLRVITVITIWPEAGVMWGVITVGSSKTTAGRSVSCARPDSRVSSVCYHRAITRV